VPIVDQVNCPAARSTGEPEWIAFWLEARPKNRRVIGRDGPQGASEVPTGLAGHPGTGSEAGSGSSRRPGPGRLCEKESCELGQAGTPVAGDRARSRRSPSEDQAFFRQRRLVGERAVQRGACVKPSHCDCVVWHCDGARPLPSQRPSVAYCVTEAVRDRGASMHPRDIADHGHDNDKAE
jgi:hypothetical protein